MKFIHAADIHLDSPLRGLARYEGAPVEQMQSATRRAFVNLIDLACEEAVDFMILAGDLYDMDWKDYNTGLFFNQQMNRLNQAGIAVYLLRGNHDAENLMTKQLRLPDNVHVFSAQQPETFVIDALGVALHGQSFAGRAVTEDLSEAYPPALAGLFNIGVLHTSLNGREGHQTYAPCTLSGLLMHGYDYWALGHVHKREVLNEQPYVVFAGNLQGRHARETGAKSCTLVEVQGKEISLRACEVDVLRWEVLELDACELQQIDELLDQADVAVTQALQQAEERPLAVRLVVTGRSSLHSELHSQFEQWSNDLRATINNASFGKAWVEKIQLKTQPLRDNLPLDGPLTELFEILRALPDNAAELQKLGEEFKGLKQALPSELRTREEGFDPESPETIKALLPQVEELLLGRLSA
ncbi:MAG: DNA repair exonuclease [Thiotrichaceae bacterium]|nr:DNA repair exonuclease [Thiotrichaceae bacterium]